MAKNIYVQGVVPQAIRAKEGSAAFVGLQIVRTNGTEVWKRGITLTNSVGRWAMQASKSWSDAGFEENNISAGTLSLNSAHRYFVYVEWSGYGYEYNPQTSFAYNAWVQLDTTSLVSKNTNTPFHRETKSAKTIVSGFGYTNLLLHYSRSGVWQGDAIATFYMVMDITALEAEKGTMTADQVWTFIGGSVFYGSKDFDV